MLLLFLMTKEKKTSRKSLSQNVRKKRNMRKRLVNSLYRWIGSIKNLKNCLDLTTRVNLVKNHSKNKESNLPVSVVAKLASINRTFYYKGAHISDEELECKRIIDRLYTDNPTWGARQMSSHLKQCGYMLIVKQNWVLSKVGL